MNTIITKVRDLIKDNISTGGRDVFTYESTSSSKIFTLTESNIDSTSIIVYRNGSVWASSNYSYSTTTGKLTITGSLTAGDSLEIYYSYYSKYSDIEIQGSIRAAISNISVGGYKTFAVKSDNVIFPTPDECEENLIAVIASILINGDIVGYRTPELTISFERGDNKDKKIKKLLKHFSKSFGILGYINLK